MTPRLSELGLAGLHGSSPDVGIVGASAFFGAGTWERLRRVKSLHDPQDVFKGNHHVPPMRRLGG